MTCFFLKEPLHPLTLLLEENQPLDLIDQIDIETLLEDTLQTKLAGSDKLHKKITDLPLDQFDCNYSAFPETNNKGN